MQELVGVRALSAELSAFRALGAFRRAGRALELIVAIVARRALVKTGVIEEMFVDGISLARDADLRGQPTSMTRVAAVLGNF